MRRRTMSGRRWGFDPLRDELRFHRIDPMFDESNSAPLGGRGGVEPCCEPVCNVEETDTNYLVTASMPGVSRESLNVELRGNQLYLSSEREGIVETENIYGMQTERECGCFEKVIELASDVDPYSIEASCDGGVCRISISKMTKANEFTPAMQFY